MDLRQLSALVAVADHGSFSAAARSLHTVQSNVSTHVARLERELGATLVDRASGTLTPEGQIVVARSRRVQAELDALAADVASAHADVSGPVRIGVIGTTARWLVPRLLEEMGEHYPGVHVVVVDATTTSLVPQLVNGQLDLAVVNLPVDDPDIVIQPLFEEDRVLVAPAGHPFYDAERLTLADLGREPLLLEPVGTSFRDQLDLQTRDAGIRLVPQAEVDGMRLLASLAFQGFGAALLPASAAPSWVGGDWRRIPVDGLQGRSVGLGSRRRGLLSAPARASVEVLRRVVEVDGEAHGGIRPATTIASPPPSVLGG